MNYNFTNSYGSYNYGQMQPNYYQQPIQPVQQMQQQVNTNNQVQMNQYAFVNGIEGAKSFLVAPNQTILLMDSDNPIVYMKQANSLGQSSLRYFKLIETTEEQVRNGKEPKLNENYALKSDLEALNKKIDEISSRIEKPFIRKNKGGINNG